MKTLITFVAVLVAVPAFARDVNFGALTEDDHIVNMTTGAEHGLVLGLGYGRVLSIADRPVVVGGDAALQWAEVDVRDFKLRGGALAPIAGRGAWKVIGGLAGTIRGTRNDIARMISAGADVSVLAGRYAPRWFAVVEAGLDWAGATHIAHRDGYRMQVYADARDGWYGNSATTLRAGLQGGVSFGGNDIVLRAGRLQPLEGSPLFPWYATLGYDRRW